MYESDSNYYGDRRVRGAERRWWENVDTGRMQATVTVHFFDEEENSCEEDRQVPVKFEVCSTCSGKGSHVNPSIDCDGLTRDDFDQDPDFLDEYMSGRYDVPCYECHGQRVVPVIDEDRCDPETLKLIRQREQEQLEYARERASERRFGY